MKHGYLLLVILVSQMYAAGMDSHQKLELIKTFAPFLKFDSAEYCYPGSVATYLQQSFLQGVQEIVALSDGIPEKMKHEHYNNKRYYIKLCNTSYKAEQLLKHGTINAPCYAHMVDKLNGTKIIQYVFFFPSNGSQVIKHQEAQPDWQHVDVYLTKPTRTYQFDKIYIPHKNVAQAQMLNALQISFNKKTHPVLYVSRGTHDLHHQKSAGYNFTKKYDGDGSSWDCSENIIDTGIASQPTQGNEWLTFVGLWGGPQGSQGPAQQKWWREQGNQSFPIARIKVSEGTPPFIETKSFDVAIPNYIRKLRWVLEVDEMIGEAPTSPTQSFSLKHKGIFCDTTLIENIENGCLTDIPAQTKNLFITGLLAHEIQHRNLYFNIQGIEE